MPAKQVLTGIYKVVRAHQSLERLRVFEVHHEQEFIALADLLNVFRSQRAAGMGPSVSRCNG